MLGLKPRTQEIGNKPRKFWNNNVHRTIKRWNNIISAHFNRGNWQRPGEGRRGRARNQRKLSPVKCERTRSCSLRWSGCEGKLEKSHYTYDLSNNCRNVLSNEAVKYCLWKCNRCACVVKLFLVLSLRPVFFRGSFSDIGKINQIKAVTIQSCLRDGQGWKNADFDKTQGKKHVSKVGVSRNVASYKCTHCKPFLHSKNLCIWSL